MSCNHRHGKEAIVIDIDRDAFDRMWKNGKTLDRERRQLARFKSEFQKYVLTDKLLQDLIRDFLKENGGVAQRKSILSEIQSLVSEREVHPNGEDVWNDGGRLLGRVDSALRRLERKGDLGSNGKGLWRLVH